VSPDEYVRAQLWFDSDPDLGWFEGFGFRSGGLVYVEESDFEHGGWLSKGFGDYERYLSRKRGDKLIIMGSSCGLENIGANRYRLLYWAYDGWRSGGWICLGWNYYARHPEGPCFFVFGENGGYLEAAYNFEEFGDVSQASR
jgi:hypothetical protein